MRVCGVYECKGEFYISRWIKGFKGFSLLEEGRRSELKVGKGERVVLALPSKSVLLKSLELPLSDPGKIKGALPFEMAEELAGETSEYLFSFYFIKKERKFSKVVGGGAKKETVQSEMKRLELRKAEVTSSSVAFLNSLLEREDIRDNTLYCFKGESEGIILLANGKEILFERSVSPSRLIEESELSKKLLGEKVTDIKVLEDPVMIARGSALGALNPRRFAHLNLLEESGSLNRFLRENQRELKRVAVALVLLAFAWGLSWGVDYRNTMSELRKIEQGITENYKRYFGEGKVVNPVLQAKRRVEELESSLKKRSSSGVLPLLLLERISESIPASLEVRFNGIHIMVNNIEIEGTARSFEEVDSLKKALERAFKGVEVSYARLSADGKSVSFGIKLKEMI